MALLFVDGFDHAQPNKIDRKYTFLASGVTQLTTIAGRYDLDSSYQNFAMVPFNSGFGRFSYQRDVPVYTGFFVYAFDFKTYRTTSGTFATSSDFFETYSLNTSTYTRHIRLMVTAAGRLQLWVGSGLNGTGTMVEETPEDTISYDTWVRLEIKLGTSTGVQVRVNGSVVLDQPGTPTHLSGGRLARLGWCWESFGNDGYALDNLYLLDDSGPENNNYLGNVVVSTTLPAEDISQGVWLPSSGIDAWEMVNDRFGHPTIFQEYPDGDASYILASSATSARFKFPRFFPVGELYAVVLSVYAKSTDGATVTGTAYETLNVPEYAGVALTVDTDYTVLQTILEQDPVDGEAWDEVDFVDQRWQFGVRNVNGNTLRVSQLALERLHAYAGGAAADYKIF